MYMHPWHDIDSARITPDRFLAIVEISRGSKTKYELDKATGLIRLDRILYTSTHYPANYGMIPKTYAEDNDPLDVLILCQEALQPMSLVSCLPIGVMTMIDNHELDEKIIAVPENDPVNASYKDISELPPHLMSEIKHFFEVYKALEFKPTAVDRFEDHVAAKESIARAIALYHRHFDDKGQPRETPPTA
jgi:inorganic pyrophosphatase